MREGGSQVGMHMDMYMYMYMIVHIYMYHIFKMYMCQYIHVYILCTCIIIIQCHEPTCMHVPFSCCFPPPSFLLSSSLPPSLPSPSLPPLPSPLSLTVDQSTCQAGMKTTRVSSPSRGRPLPILSPCSPLTSHL